MLDFVALAHACAPHVHVSTLAAIVRHESGFRPLAIGVNGHPHRTIIPNNRQEAIRHVRQLLSAGKSFDAGYGQINVRNWAWLGITPENVLDPCTNLTATQAVLRNCYQRATARHQAGQQALYAAFSCYNTGNMTAGFSNGYVRNVITVAGLDVPGLLPDTKSPAYETSRRAEIERKPEARSSPPTNNDAFASPAAEVFATSPPDAFHRAAPTAFGSPVPIPLTR